MEINFLDNKSGKKKVKKEVFDVEYSSIKKDNVGKNKINKKEQKDLKKNDKEGKNSIIDALFSFFRKKESVSTSRNIHKSRRELLKAIKKEKNVKKKKAKIKKISLFRKKDKVKIEELDKSKNKKEDKEKKVAFLLKDDNKNKNDVEVDLVKALGNSGKIKHEKKNKIAYEPTIPEEGEGRNKNKEKAGEYKKEDNGIFKVFKKSFFRKKDKVKTKEPSGSKDQKEDKEEDVAFLLKDDDKNKGNVEVDLVKALGDSAKIKHEKKKENVFEYTNPKGEDGGIREGKDAEKDILRKFEDKKNSNEKSNFLSSLIQRFKRIFKKDGNSVDNNPRGNKKDGSSGLIETNLIKDKIIVYINWKNNLTILSIFLSITFLLSGGVYYGLATFEKEQDKELKSITEELVFLEEKIKIAEQGAEEVVVFKNKLSVAGGLLDQHVYWTNFFEFLEKNTLKDVFFSGFNGGYGESYNLAATASSFASIEAQVKKMKENEYVESIRVESGQSAAIDNKETDGVSFSMNIKINPKMLLNN